ncbi:hypothetical protein RND81_09G073600 [Saponaria officinalis]|uniref:Transmembrane protein n=1 Tax=Saponaria officinalis TaxID=3572 RepID=A0AAW1IJV7_SAPOF
MKVSDGRRGLVAVGGWGRGGRDESGGGVVDRQREDGSGGGGGRWRWPVELISGLFFCFFYLRGLWRWSVEVMVEVVGGWRSVEVAGEGGRWRWPEEVILGLFY